MARRAWHSDEPVKPRPSRKRTDKVHHVHNASGFPDVIVDDDHASLIRDGESHVERPSSLGGYEDPGEAIGDDVEADA